MFAEFLTLKDKPEYVIELHKDRILLYKDKSWTLLTPEEITDSPEINTIKRLKRYLNERNENLAETVDNYVKRVLYV